MELEQMVPAGEVLIQRCHPHPIRLVGAGLRSAGLLVLGLGLLGIVGYVARLGGDTTGEHRVAGLLAVLPAGLTGLGLILIAGSLGQGLWAWWSWRATEYAVTCSERADQPGGSLIQIGGVLRRESVITPLWQINDLQLDLPILGRLLGYGTLRILTSNDLVQVLPYVPTPQTFYQLCQSGRLIPLGRAMRRPTDRAAARPPEPSEPSAQW